MNKMLFICKIPYSGNLSRVKTFANFAVLRKFAKVLTAKIFIEYGGIVINGRVIVVPTIRESFNREKSDFLQFTRVFTY